MKLANITTAVLVLFGSAVLLSVVSRRPNFAERGLAPQYVAEIHRRLCPEEVAIGHTREAAGARYSLYEFGDFECPACRAGFPALEAAIDSVSTPMSFTFFHLPLAQHVHARDAAAAMIAASNQGKTWEAYRALFTMPHLDRSDLLALGRSLRLDEHRYRKDMDSAATQARIDTSLLLCRKYRVRATPTLVLISPDGRATQITSEVELHDLSSIAP